MFRQECTYTWVQSALCMNASNSGKGMVQYARFALCQCHFNPDMVEGGVSASDVSSLATNSKYLVKSVLVFLHKRCETPLHLVRSQCEQLQ